MRWSSHGKFYCLANILLMAYLTRRYINTIVCMPYQVLLQREGFVFCHYLWNTWEHGFVVFSTVFMKCTVLAWPCMTFTHLSFAFLCCLKHSACSFLAFVQLRYILCRKPVPSYLSLFFFDRVSRWVTDVARQDSNDIIIGKTTVHSQNVKSGN